MKIKLLTATILMGFANAVPAGGVVESEDELAVKEFEALININYAKETKEAVTHRQDGFKAVEPVLVKVDEGELDLNQVEFQPQEGDADLLGILEGTVAEVTEFIGELSAEEIARLGLLELRGQARKGVMAAITAALETE